MSLIELLSVGDAAQQEQKKIYGVVTGIVRDLRDPAKQGRVKLDFPWLAEEDQAVTLESGESRAHSFWARIALLMAGKERGAWFIPEVGDEVLVAFEHGNMDRPLILGMLWNKDDPPPEKMDGDGKNDIRALHSRSGHKIVFNDSKDKPSITIGDKKDENHIVLNLADGNIEIKAVNNLTIEAGGDIEIKAQGQIVLDAGKDLKAAAKNNLAIDAGAEGSITSKAPMRVESQATLTAGGKETTIKGVKVAVKGDALTEVKAKLVTIN